MIDDPNDRDLVEPSDSAVSPEELGGPLQPEQSLQADDAGIDALSRRLRQREAELAKLAAITERINQGVELEEILDFLYGEMRGIIPYNRIGFSVIDPEGRTAVSRWARSDRPVSLHIGYRGSIERSSLQTVLRSGRPRIINDLVAHLCENPQSHSTSLIVKEGMRSSLTCPLINEGKAVGFLFFSSDRVDCYGDVHVEFFEQIAGQLATIVEKGRLFSELARQKEHVERQNALLTRDLEMARLVQAALVPRSDVKLGGVELAFRYEPAAEVGGDVLDLVPLDGSRLLAFVGDAVGHGVPAALVMSVAKTALHGALRYGHKPGSILALINSMLAGMFENQFVTAACCLLNRQELVAEVALAGTRGPLWYRAASQRIEQLQSDGLPLGLDSDVQFNTHLLRLEPGDRLLFYTDGIVEAQDDQQRPFGKELLERMLAEHKSGSPEAIVHQVCQRVRGHCHPRTMDDDCTLLALEITPT